eukprot:768553-Hanusia_phi.AAC.10
MPLLNLSRPLRVLLLTNPISFTTYLLPPSPFSSLPSSLELHPHVSSSSSYLAECFFQLGLVEQNAADCKQPRLPGEETLAVSRDEEVDRRWIRGEYEDKEERKEGRRSRATRRMVEEEDSGERRQRWRRRMVEEEDSGERRQRWWWRRRMVKEETVEEEEDGGGVGGYQPC